MIPEEEWHKLKESEKYGMIANLTQRVERLEFMAQKNVDILADAVKLMKLWSEKPWEKKK